MGVSQPLTVTGVIPSTGTTSYSWVWLISTNAGAFVPLTQCVVNGGSGAAGGATETCSLPANTLTAGNTYTFELEVNDNASTPETQRSTASSVVVVGSPSTSSSSFPWIWVLLGAAAGAAVLGLLLGLSLMRRHRRPAAGTAPPVPPWLEEQAPPPGGPHPTPASTYTETPEDQGYAPAPLPATKHGACASPAASAQSKPDINSLIAELDQLSTDILSRAPKKPDRAKKPESPDQDASH